MTTPTIRIPTMATSRILSRHRVLLRERGSSKKGGGRSPCATRRCSVHPHPAMIPAPSNLTLAMMHTSTMIMATP